MRLIERIIKANLCVHEGKLFIRRHCVYILTKSIIPVNSCVLLEKDGQEYLEVEHLPEATYRQLGFLFDVAFLTRELTDRKDESDVEKALRIFESEQAKEASLVEFLKLDFEDVIRDPSHFEPTYLDFKFPPEVARRKALTHGLLLYIFSFIKKCNRYDEAFKLLIELKPDCELPLDSLKKFYKQVKLLSRTGLPHGLLFKEKPPLADSS